MRRVEFRFSVWKPVAILGFFQRGRGKKLQLETQQEKPQAHKHSETSSDWIFEETRQNESLLREENKTRRYWLYRHKPDSFHSFWVLHEGQNFSA